MKTRLLALLILLATSGAHAGERMIWFTNVRTMMEEVQPMLNAGWAVKHLATSEFYYVVVLEPPPPKEPAISATGERLPVPGGLEERRAKLLATKPEAQKP